MEKPTGKVTFLFTDIEGSTKLAQEFHENLQNILLKHHSILNDAVANNNGFVFKTIGDAFCCAFQNAEDAVKASIESQIRLINEKWDAAVIKVRMGIHTGNAVWDGKDYMGYITLARTQRVMSSAYGGQIIVSNDTYESVKERLFFPDNSELSFRDFGERRLKDLIEPVRLFQINFKGMQTEFPPLKTLDARPNNIPFQLTSFIGRENEINEINNILKNSKLLTLVGTGGTGKTRLAMQVGADMIDDFENGVFIAELANVSDPILTAETVLNIFSIKIEPGNSPEEALEIFLKSKEMLLILDNCEHLIHECSKLAEDLLSKCSRLKILATSREALNCSGERIYRVPSLSSPDPSLAESPAQLTQYASVRLFIERALSVNQNFSVNNENLPALSEICFRLDGIPLAIELAAARTKTMSIEKIYERLDNSFNLLVGGTRTSLPRQQTLKALIGWSYDLTTDNEKKLWNRLSVFKGGWTLESSEEICSDELILKDEIPVLLSHLVEKSIIIYNDADERFKILETIRQFGEVKLKEENEAEKFYNKHLDHFVNFLTESNTRYAAKETPEWLKMAETEESNIVSAIEWSVISGNSQKGAIAADEFNRFWDIRGHYLSGIRLIENLIENNSEIKKETLSYLYINAGHLYRAQGNYENAKKYFETSIQINRELGNDKGMILSLQSMANVEAGFGNFQKAQKLFEESLDLSRKINFVGGIAFGLNNLGNVSLIQGDYKQAEIYVKEGLEMNRKSGNKHRLAFSLDSMGNIMTELGRYEEAQKYLEESLELTREVGDKSGITFALTNLSGIAYRSGNITQAQNYLEESLKMRIELGDKNGIAYVYYNLGEIFFNEKIYEKARKYFTESLKLRIELHDKHGIAVSLLAFSDILIYDEKYFDSAKLLGAVESILKYLGMDEVTLEFTKLKKIIAELKEKINDNEFKKHFEIGNDLTPEKAAELALAVSS